MVDIQRSRYFMLRFQDEQQLDLRALLRGQIETSAGIELLAISALTDSEQRVTPAEIELLARIPAEPWQPLVRLATEIGVRAERLEALVRKGLAISTANDRDLKRLREREEVFRRTHWNPQAAVYHLMIRYPTGLDRKADRSLIDIEAMAAGSPQAIENWIERHGEPPSPFYRWRDAHSTPEHGTQTQSPHAADSIKLPLKTKRGSLYRALEQRRTVRCFNHDAPIALSDLATLLYYVFGCHGYAHLSSTHTILHRTSPSGGSLHPIEAYALVQHVSGLEPGLYHYHTRRHALDLIRLLARAQTERLAIEMAAGQAFVASAPVLLALTARFDRNFWKYRENVKTHSVVLLDAGHLSQTFQLVASDHGLGAFFVAHDADVVEQALGLDGIEQGAVALVGCGKPVSDSPDFGIDFIDFVPGQTDI